LVRALYRILTLKTFKSLLFKKHFKRNSFEILVSAKRALDSSKVKFWIDFGTLLGIYREGDVIENDLDMDLGMYLSEYTEKVDNAFYKEGFKLYRKIVIDEGKYGLEVSFIKKGIKIDLFCYSKFNSHLFKVHSFSNFPGLGLTKSIKEKGELRVIEQCMPLKNFKVISFKDEEFLIPSNTEEYLSYHYGKDFMTPRRWDYTDLDNDNIHAIVLDDKVGKVYFG